MLFTFHCLEGIASVTALHILPDNAYIVHFKTLIHLYHSAAILESVGNKDFVFASSLHCLCPSSLTLNERFDGQNLWFGH